jgi:hypothetical protein
MHKNKTNAHDEDGAQHWDAIKGAEFNEGRAGA